MTFNRGELLLLGLCAALALGALWACTPVLRGGGRPGYPPAPRGSVVEDYHGTRGRRPVPLARGARLACDARLGRGRGAADRCIPRAAAAARAHPRPHRRALRLREDRRAVQPGRALLLHQQQRAPGSERAADGPGSRRGRRGGARPERAAAGGPSGGDRLRPKPRRPADGLRGIAVGVGLDRVAHPRPGKRHRPAGRARAHQVLPAGLQPRRQGPVLRGVPGAGGRRRAQHPGQRPRRVLP